MGWKVPVSGRQMIPQMIGPRIMPPGKRPPATARLTDAATLLLNASSFTVCRSARTLVALIAVAPAVLAFFFFAAFFFVAMLCSSSEFENVCIEATGAGGREPATPAITRHNQEMASMEVAVATDMPSSARAFFVGFKLRGGAISLRS